MGASQSGWAILIARLKSHNQIGRRVAMKYSLGLPADCVCCSTHTVMRINGQPVCLDCGAHEPPAVRVLKKVLANNPSQA